MGCAPLLIAVAAAAALVPASLARGPEPGSAGVTDAPAVAVAAAPIALPPPGPMAQQRARLGSGPRGDGRRAAQRSPSGRPIQVHFHGSGTARSRVLVAGCINGRHCAGERIPVRYECPPDDAEFWFMPTLRPEGADLDRTQRHPGADALRQAVADLRPRISVLYRTGPTAVVRARGAGEAAGRRYARITGLPFAPPAAPGLADWIQQVRPGAAAITVELPQARLGWLEAMRHAFALQRLAGTRFLTPVHERRNVTGTLSVLRSSWWRLAHGGGGAARYGDLAIASFRLRERTAPLPCAPATVRRRLGRFGTLLLVRDRGDTALAGPYPPRPRHLRLGAPRWTPCLGRAHVIRFSDAGRNLEVVAAFGRDVNRWGRESAREVLDSLRVEA